MSIRILLSVLDGIALIGVLAFFLITISRLLRQIIGTLGKVAFGVRAVETQCAVIGPAVDQLNSNLARAADGLSLAKEQAVRAAR